MAELSHAQSPGQRTAVTARVILFAGLAAWASSLLSQSLAGSMLACLLTFGGGGLLMAARRAG